MVFLLRRLALFCCGVAWLGCQPPTSSPPAAAADTAYVDAMAHQHGTETPTHAGTPMVGEEGLRIERLAYAEIGGAPVTGYFVRPEVLPLGPPPGVLLIHEWWGLNPNTENEARRLAKEGYQVLAVDLYGERHAETPDSARVLMGQAMDQADLLTDNLLQAYAFLESRRAPRIGVMGWCFGGMWSLRVALALPADLDATVIYYGFLETDAAKLAPLQMPVLAFFGEDDSSIPLSDVRAFEQALKDARKDVTVVRYPDADHAFANPSGQRYQEAAATDAWKRTLAFFRQHLQVDA